MGGAKAQKLLVVLCRVNIHGDAHQDLERPLRNSDGLKKEALGTTGDLLGQDGALAQNDYTSHNTLPCFLSFNDLTPLLTTHSRPSS